MGLIQLSVLKQNNKTLCNSQSTLRFGHTCLPALPALPSLLQVPFFGMLAVHKKSCEINT